MVVRTAIQKEESFEPGASRVGMAVARAVR
jgi:hypothetical protein